MKLSIEPAVIRDIASFAMSAVNVRPPSPIMAGLLIQARDGQLRITGDDYSKRSTAKGDAEVLEPGSALIDGKLFTSIIGKLTAKKPISIENESKAVKVSQGAKVFSIPAMPYEEYPAYKSELRELGMVNGAALASALKSVIPAVAKDQALPVICGVNVALGDTITLIATDRYRIAEALIGWDSGTEDKRATVPAEWLQAVTKYVAGEVIISGEENNGELSKLAIQCGDYMTTTVLIEGDYPKAERLFSLNANHWAATFDRAELLDAIDTVAMVAERNTPVRMALQDGVATIDGGTGADATGVAKIGAEHQEDVTIAFLPKFILDGLKVHDTEKIELNIENPNKPVIITGTENLKYAAMPVRLTAPNTN